MNRNLLLKLVASCSCTFAACLFSTSQLNADFATSQSVEPVDLVYPLLDTANSRWFFFSAACRPFGMVNLTPDTEVSGAWGSGYRYNSQSIKGFSHVHAWQLAGPSVMPIDLASTEDEATGDVSSPFSHEKEKVYPGYHRIELDRWGIVAELTSTKRVGFHRYQFNPGADAAVAFCLEGQLGPCEITDARLTRSGSHVLLGTLVNAPTRRRPKPCTVFFRAEFDQEIRSFENPGGAGRWIVRFGDTPLLRMKVGLSYTSMEGATRNLRSEAPHWEFDQVVQESREEWNEFLGRIQVTGGTDLERRRFYTDLWHALQGRRIISDVDGKYPDNTGKVLRVGQLPTNKQGIPLYNHYNSDSFWGAQWTLNTLWGLAYPDIYEEFVHSLLQYEKDGGLVPRGPAGGNYTFVMTGASTTPFIVSAVQKGIVRDNLESIYEALRKNHELGGVMAKAGYEHKTALGGGLKHYLDKGYVPFPLPENARAFHVMGASQTLEYAYQDWTLAQLAKRLQLEQDYDELMKRSRNYSNLYDKQSGWIRPKNLDGRWCSRFDPYRLGNGFVEANAAQATWFVTHDLPGLAKLMGGRDAAVKQLNDQFQSASKLGFTSGDAHARESDPFLSRIPINYGNQPSIQTAFVFHGLGRPDLTQYWSRRVVNAAYSGLGPNTGYNGDEDQGLMGSLAVLLKMGIFQLTGGTELDPMYQIGSPMFDKVVIKLHPKYYSGEEFEIIANDNGDACSYIKTATYGGKEITDLTLRHSDILEGGALELLMDRSAPVLKETHEVDALIGSTQQDSPF